MTGFWVGIGLFFGIHTLGLLPGFRTALAGRLGENGYKGLYSLVSAGGFALMLFGYGKAPFEPLYQPPQWAQWVPAILMPLAFVLLVGAYASKDVARITRHPMLWAVALWAVGHLAANGDQASVALFGAFLVYSAIAMPLSDAKHRALKPAKWADSAAHTSVMPFAALVAGRARARTGDFGIVKIGVGLALFALTLWGHAWVAGVAAYQDLTF